MWKSQGLKGHSPTCIQALNLHASIAKCIYSYAYVVNRYVRASSRLGMHTL